MYNISDHFITHAHQLLFETEMPRISEAGWESISLIGNWYMMNKFTYIRLVGITPTPHLLPKYIPDKLLLKAFAFQLFEIGQTMELIRRKMKAWTKLLVPVGQYQILNHGQARKELEDYLDYRWLPDTIRHHDPKGLIKAHFRRLGLTTMYMHEMHLDDSLFKDIKASEYTIIKMRLRHIPEERMATLGHDPEVDQLEWRR